MRSALQRRAKAVDDQALKLRWRARNSGVGNGNRTRNRRSHSPVLCQLSYSHHQADYSNWGSRMSERFPPERRRLLRENRVDYSSAKRRRQKAWTRCVRDEKDTQNRAKEKLLRVPERKTERR